MIFPLPLIKRALSPPVPLFQRARRGWLLWLGSLRGAGAGHGFLGMFWLPAPDDVELLIKMRSLIGQVSAHVDQRVLPKVSSRTLPTAAAEALLQSPPS